MSDSRRLTNKKAYIRFIPDLEGCPEHISKVHIDCMEYDEDTKYAIICGHTDSTLKVKIEIPYTIIDLLK